jgi:hypothetical protein
MAARRGLLLARSVLLAIPPKGLLSRPGLGVPSLRSSRTFRTRHRTTVLPQHQPLLSDRAPYLTLTDHRRLFRNFRFNSSTSKLESVEPDSPTPPAPTPSSSPASPSTPFSAPPVTVAPSPSPPAAPQIVSDTASIIKLVSLAKPQWRLLSIGVGCLVVSTGVNLAIPWVIGRIIDFFTPGSEATLLFGYPLEQATAFLALALLVGAAANSGRSIALRLSGQRTSAAIRRVPISL